MDIIPAVQTIRNRSSSSAWYVIHTKPRQEDRADASLKTLGLETLNPKVQPTLTCAYSMPLFPRYIFAHFHLEQMLRKVRWSRGVHNIVEFGGTPATIDGSTVELIRSRLTKCSPVVTDSPFHIGARLRILEGPFRDLIGVFERQIQDKERVMILLSYLDFHARLIVDKTALERADNP
jgi:transcriptional antiterminator RfaH